MVLLFLMLPYISLEMPVLELTVALRFHSLAPQI